MPQLTPQAFATTAAESDAYEIAAGRCALAQSRHAQVRAFAQEMVAGHSRMTQALREAAQASRLESPRPAVNGDQARFLATLQSLTGAAFDRAYARQQVLVHVQALTVMRSYAATGSDPNLRRAAQAALPVIEHHLQSAQQMRSAVGGA